MTTTQPLTSLRAAEASLLGALSSTADALDAVGTAALDDALARLEAAAGDARARLAGALSKVQFVVASLAEALGGLADGVRRDLAGERPGGPGGPGEPPGQAPPQPWAPEPSPDDVEGPAEAARPAPVAPFTPDGCIELAGPVPVAVAACAPVTAVNDEPPLTPAPLFPLPPDDGPYGKGATPTGKRPKRRKGR